MLTRLPYFAHSLAPCTHRVDVTEMGASVGRRLHQPGCDAGEVGDLIPELGWPSPSPLQPQQHHGGQRRSQVTNTSGGRPLPPAYTFFFRQQVKGTTVGGELSGTVCVSKLATPTPNTLGSVRSEKLS
jgi:hypothetical protein